MSEPQKIPLSAQASAIDNALSILRRGAKPTERDLAFLSERLTAAAASLRFVEGHDAEFREFVRRRNAGEAS